MTLGAGPAASPANTRNFQRITLWLIVSGVLGITGGLVESELRLCALDCRGWRSNMPDLGGGFFAARPRAIDHQRQSRARAEALHSTSPARDPKPRRSRSATTVNALKLRDIGLDSLGSQRPEHEQASDPPG